MIGILIAGAWGLVAASSLLIGCALGLWGFSSRRVIGLTMAFGAGVLISSLAVELMEEAFSRGGFDAAVGGLLAGGISYFLADLLVSRGARHRKRSQGQQKGSTANALVIGALMDGIPESAAIGVTLLGGGRVSLVMVAAVFLSNVPEAMSASAGTRKVGHGAGFIFAMWSGVALLAGLAAAGGYAFLDGASGNLIGGLQAFSAGAVLTMLASTMMPEAYAEGGSWVGLFTTCGFLVAFVLAKLKA
jgi:ZIP family zinc transporter